MYRMQLCPDPFSTASTWEVSLVPAAVCLTVLLPGQMHGRLCTVRCPAVNKMAQRRR